MLANRFAITRYRIFSFFKIFYKYSQTIANTGAVGFFDEVESLKKETKKLRENGVNIIIGLGHSGIEMDKVIAREVEDIDLIVGGHSHTFLYSGKAVYFGSSK